MKKLLCTNLLQGNNHKAVKTIKVHTYISKYDKHDIIYNITNPFLIIISGYIAVIMQSYKTV